MFVVVALCMGFFPAIVMAGEDPNLDGDNLFKSVYFWIAEAIFGVIGIVGSSMLGI